jgi:hypothetical protein
MLALADFLFLRVDAFQLCSFKFLIGTGSLDFGQSPLKAIHPALIIMLTRDVNLMLDIVLFLFTQWLSGQ